MTKTSRPETDAQRLDAFEAWLDEQRVPFPGHEIDILPFDRITASRAFYAGWLARGER